MKTNLIFCLTILSLISTRLFGQQLELKIITSKTEFILAEPIEIGIILKNIGEDIFKGIQPHLVLGSLSIEIRDYSGVVIPYTGLISPSTAVDFELKPQEEEYILVSSDENFGNQLCKNMSTRYIKVDDYTLQAFYTSFDTQLKSNIISIKIENPTNQELNVYNRFNDITNNIDFSTNEKIVESIMAYKVLVEENPNSVYAPIILVKISSLYLIRLGDKLEAMRIRKSLLEDYPNSAKGQHLLDPVLKEFVNDIERENFLISLKINSKNSLMEKIITDKLEKLHTGENLNEIKN